MNYRIVHSTRYTGNAPFSVGHNESWLTPRATSSQKLITTLLEILPKPSILSQRKDYFDNIVTQFSFNQGYDSLSVTAINHVEVLPEVRDLSNADTWQSIRDQVRTCSSPEELQAYEFTFDSPRCRCRPEFAEYCALSFASDESIVDSLRRLLKRFFSDFKFDPTATTVTSPVEQVFKQRRGVCQDFSHLMISMLRSIGLPARYISGYLRTLPPPGKVKLIGADASHAWVSVYCGALGWVDIDPTNNTLAGLDHITVAWGRDYGDVTPLKGVYIGGGTSRLTVSVDVSEVESSK